MGAYLRLARIPGLLSLMAAQLLARLPQGLLSIAVLLHVEHQIGSYTVAGAVVALEGVGQAVSAPIAGRALTVFGVRRVLVIATSFHTLALLLLACLPMSSSLALALGGLVGISTPPVVPVVRSLFPRIVPESDLPAVFALDTTAQELIWILGPVLAALFGTTLSTEVGLGVAAGCALTGTAAMLCNSLIRSLVLPRSVRTVGRALLHPTVGAAMIGTAMMVATFTAMEVGALAKYEGNGLIAGLALALASAASLVGGITVGSRRLSRATVVCCLATGVVGPLAAGYLPGAPLFFLAFFVSGLGFAPALSALHHAVAVDVEERSAPEAFGWLMTAGMLGAALGTFTAGRLVDTAGIGGTFLGATLFGIVAMTVPLVTKVIKPSQPLHVTASG